MYFCFLLNYSPFHLKIKKSHCQPSQNVPAAGNVAAYNKMSVNYFIVKFTNNKYEVSSAAYYTVLQPSCLLLKNILTGLHCRLILYSPFSDFELFTTRSTFSYHCEHKHECAVVKISCDICYSRQAATSCQGKT